MDKTDTNTKSTNKYLVYLAIFLSAFGFIAVTITRDIWLLLVMIPAAIYLHRNRPKNKKEEDERNNATIISFSLVFLLPVAVILIFLLYFFISRALPEILKSL
jgi:hypothetical protein